jgi:hypothetical protein
LQHSRNFDDIPQPFFVFSISSFHIQLAYSETTIQVAQEQSLNSPHLSAASFNTDAYYPQPNPFGFVVIVF